jgi:hypothetical protein
MLCCLVASGLAGDSWHGTYAISNYEYGTAVAIAPDGDIILGIESGHDYDVERSTVLLKIDPAGTIVWQRQWGIWGTIGLAVGSDGAIWVAQGVEGTRDIYLLHLDGNGDLLGSRRIRLHSAEELGSIVRLKAVQDELLLLGYEYSWPEGPYFAIRLNAGGWPVWDREFEPFIRLSDVDVGLEGAYWLSGAEGRLDAILLKLSAGDGSIQAAFRYPRSSDYWSNLESIFLSVRQMSDGTLMGVARSDVGHHLSDSWVVRLDGDASVLSYKVTGYSATAAAIHADGYALIGYSPPYFSSSRQAIVAISPESGALWSAEYVHDWEYSYFSELGVDPLGRVAFAGSGSLPWEPGQDMPVVVATAGMLEPDGTVPGCGFVRARAWDSDELSLVREPLEVGSYELPIDMRIVDINVVHAHGFADICHATGNHRRPTGMP